MTGAPRVLLVDDEPQMLRLLVALLGEGYAADTAASGAEAIGRVSERAYDAVLTDLMMPSMDGIELLRLLRDRDRDLPIVLLTAQATVETAVRAMREGAFDYLRKTVTAEELRAAVDRAVRHGALVREVQRLRSEIDAARGLPPPGAEAGGILGQSARVREMLALAERVAGSDASVLLLGESGTGKELLARHIHRLGPRRDGPFVAFDGSALAPSLIESELFGHEKGAFTGSVRARRGLFREAHGGSLFLDEIGDLASETQNKLLRVLQEREIRPVGGDSVIKVDVRIVAATNKDLKGLVARGTFREDLYYRLAVLPIEVPPLRDRLDDLPLLCAHFLAHPRGAGRRASGIDPAAMTRLASYGWPGNVRELENVIERAAILADGETIRMRDLPALGSESGAVPDVSRSPDGAGARAGRVRPLKDLVGEATRAVETHAIREALRQTEGNPTRAAQLLRISRASLYAKLKQYAIEA